MSWIKRNLFFAVGGAVTLVLMGLAFFYLFSKIREEAQVSEELNAKVEQLGGIVQQEPFPSETNVVAVAREKERLLQFLATARSFFSPAATQGIPKDVRSFLAFLENSVAELTRDATNSGVALPQGFSFAFTAHRKKPNLNPPSFEPWTTQMDEIKTICGILFGAHINGLESIRRAPVAAQDTPSATDLLPTTMATNVAMNAVFSPYELAFRGFSGELAAVMEGFIKASNCFILKSVNIEPGRFVVQSPTVTTPGAVPGAPVFVPFERQKSSAEIMAERYGLNRPGGVVAPPPPVYIPPPNRAPDTNMVPTIALAEKPLRVVMLIEVVKFRSDKR